MKDEHDLRRARFARIQRYGSDFIESATRPRHMRVNCHRAGSFRFATTREREHECKSKRRILE